MAAVTDLSEDERYLFAILQDQSGIDPAEFAWTDETAPDFIFRCYDFQYPWYRNKSKFQIDQAARAIGKSVGIQMRAWAFCFTNPGEEMLITAPEMIHLDPVTKYIEDRIMSTRLTREFLKKSGTSNGFTHRPFEARFRNGSSIKGRIPQKDGKGVKGCVAPGTMVLTTTGHRPIEDIREGDYVLSHKGNWCRVRGNYRYDDVDGFEIAGGGHRGLVMSNNHRMLARRNRNPQRVRNLESPDWTIVDEPDLTERYYFGSPTTVPALPVPPAPCSDLEALLQLAGAYVADGCPRGDGRGIELVDDQDEVDRLKSYAQALGLGSSARRRHGRAWRVEVYGTAVATWLREQFGQLADGKRLPAWLLGAEERYRKTFLNAYLQGDGYWDAVKDRWQTSTASKTLAIDLRLLGQSLGYVGSYSWIDPRPNAMCAAPKRSHRVTFSTSIRNAVLEDAAQWMKVRRVAAVEIPTVWDLNVEEDHSYLADGLFSHNQHPKKLEMDEAQDYPEAGWVELGETLKYGEEDATWRSHGVSRGVRDRYYKQTQPESGWHVHRITAMHRNDWSPAERDAKAELYGSRDHPDYRRNILGLHGDASSALFVLTRLMACVDQNKDSLYNMNEYHHVRINDEKLRDTGMPIAELLDFPLGHKAYERTWVGMDVGMCTDEGTEIFTQRGWLTLDEVRAGDQTLSIDESDGRSYWTAIDSVHIFDDNGQGRAEWDMVAMKGKTFDALVTPRHRWLVRDYCDRLTWKTTTELNSKDQVPYAVPRGDLPVVPTHKDDLVKLAGWYFTEGSVNNKGSLSICQSATANPDYVHMIRDLLTRLYGRSGEVLPGPKGRGGPLWSEKVRTGIRTGHLRDDDAMHYFHLSAVIRDELSALVTGRERVPAPEFLGSLTEEQLAAFVTICGLGDGWEQAGRQLFQQNSEARIKAYEYACTLLGMAVSTKRYTRTTNVHDEVYEYWHTGILGRRMVAPVGSAMQARNGNGVATVTKERYEGRVWCPKLSRGNWLARRNGSVYFTGNTNHPSEILVYGEEYNRRQGSAKEDDWNMRLKLIARIHLERISSPDQRAVLNAIWDFYRPLAISMDRTGLGLPIYQEIVESKILGFSQAMRGYNFSEKIVIGYEKDDDEYDPDKPYGEEVKANVLEYSSDMLRLMVDKKEMLLPWDIDLIREFQGQTYQIAKSSTDPYGKKQFNKGKFHALDAARMAILGFQQERIDQLKEVIDDEPVYDMFLLPG